MMNMYTKPIKTTSKYFNKQSMYVNQIKYILGGCLVHNTQVNSINNDYIYKYPGIRNNTYNKTKSEK